MKKGFTLLELLVVVLIIGILAAIALPQYQKTVDKARVSEVVQNLRVLQQAVDEWYLAHPNTDSMWGEEAFNNLSIELPCESDEYEVCVINKHTYRVEISSSGMADVYSYLDGHTYHWVTIGAARRNGTWDHWCGYNGKREKAICESLQGYHAEEGWDL